MKAPSGHAVVVPIRSFTAAKTRLASVLSDAERRALARHCAKVVLRAAQPLTVYVVCDDAEVAEWARTHGASVVSPGISGLNEAAAAGRAAARDDGYRSAIIVHADLPRVESLVPLTTEDADVVIVPDRHGDGTNALVVPTGGEFDFRYGPGSSDAHRHEAARLGLTWRLLQRADVALDLDTIDDLRAAGLDAASLPSSD